MKLKVQAIESYLKREGAHRKTTTPSCGRFSVSHFRYLTCLLDRGHINQLVRQPFSS